MMLVLLCSRLTPAAGDDAAAMAAQMDAHARTFPGFVDVRSFRADDGERLTVVWWKDAETLAARAADARHRAAQRAGGEKWYEYYKMDIAEIVRVSNFNRFAATVEAHDTQPR